MHNPAQRTPVGLFQLDENDTIRVYPDPAQHKQFIDMPANQYRDERGRTPVYMIEQVNEERWYFPSREDADKFAIIHGLIPVQTDVLEQLRKVEE